MEAYKFATTILENGVLKIPELENFTDKKVEVLVLVKPDYEYEKQEKSLDGFMKICGIWENRNINAKQIRAKAWRKIEW